MLDSDIKFYAPETVDDTSSNGGLMSTTLYQSGAVAEVFPHAQKAERDNGSVKYRKVNIKNTQSDDEVFLSPQIFFDVPTPADDWAMFFAATESDTQGDITGSERKYGVAFLSTDATASSNTLIVTVEDVSQTGIFADGDVIRVTDMTDVLDDGTGNEEWHTINGTPSVSSLEITITTDDSLTNGFLVSGNARVMSVYEPGNMLPSTSAWSESGAGTYDEATYPVEVGNEGTIAETWTLTFSDATNFTVSGATVGALAAGTVGSDYSPNNPDTGTPYFTLLSAGFGGTWANTNTITWKTHPSSVEIWEKREIPSSCVSLQGNYIDLIVAGESI